MERAKWGIKKPSRFGMVFDNDVAGYGRLFTSVIEGPEIVTSHWESFAK